MKALLSAVMIGLAACCMTGLAAPPVGGTHNAIDNSLVVLPDVQAYEAEAYLAFDFAQSTVGPDLSVVRCLAFINPAPRPAAISPSCGTVLRLQNVHPDTADPANVPFDAKSYVAYIPSAWRMPADDDPAA